MRMLVLGAHPDDAEFHAGGLITSYLRVGHKVKIISVTNGAAGHHWRQPAALAQVRRQEAEQVAKRFGVEYAVWDFPDGELQPTLDVRRQIIGEIRRFAPDLVLTHRTCDYHPDHRAVGLAVQDASYMVTVPHIVPDVPALRKDPVVAYMNDLFTKPYPLTPDIVLDISPFIDTIVEMLACHACQVFEWLPYNARAEDQLPDEPGARMKWLRHWYCQRAHAVANRFRSALVTLYGNKQGEAVEFAEAYEISEYASALSDAERKRMFMTP
jgi:LmbE family N-acetylglucosaminyl deacetylase